MDKLQEYMDRCSKHLEQYPLLQKAQDATGIDKLYIAIAGGALLLLFLLVGFGAGLICNIAGFVYPAYESFKALESENKKDDVQWLTYWVVYASFSLVEVFLDLLIYWIPFYHAFKLGILLWLFMPSTQGATFIFTHFLSPFLKNHESRIDKAMSEAVSSGSAVLADIGGVVKDMGKDVTKVVASKIVDSSMLEKKVE